VKGILEVRGESTLLVLKRARFISAAVETGGRDEGRGLDALLMGERRAGGEEEEGDIRGARAERVRGRGMPNRDIDEVSRDWGEAMADKVPRGSAGELAPLLLDEVGALEYFRPFTARGGNCM